MRTPGRTVGIPCALAAALVVAGVPATARAALTHAEAKCRQAVGTQGRVLLKNVQKALSKCLDAVSKGVLPAMTDCSIEPGAAAKIGKAETKLTTKVQLACPDAVVAQLVFGGTCYGSATAADLASCLIETHEEQALALADVAYGTTGTIPAVQQTCQSTASKEGQKLAGKRHKLIAGWKDKVGAGKLPAGNAGSAQTATSIGTSAS